MQSVLVVDDEPTILRMSRMVLSMAGYGVLTASNGVEALAAIEAMQPSVVVMDMQMPVMDGRTLFARLLTLPQRPAVIVCSAFSADKVSHELGAEAALAKPFDPDTLVALVDSLQPPA